MEILDIIDTNDMVIGTASRTEVYEKKLSHRIVHVFLFNTKGELILQKRSKYVSFCPLHWSTSVGGHVLSWETYEEAGKREYKEELWIEAWNIDLLAYLDFTTTTWIFKKIFVFKWIFDWTMNGNTQEVEKIEAFSLDTIQHMIQEGEPFHPELLFLLQKIF